MNLIEIRPDQMLIYNNTIMEDLLLDCQCALFLTDISEEETFESMQKIMDAIDNKKHPDLKKILVENKSEKEPESPSEKISKYIFEHQEIDHIKISVQEEKNLEELKLKIYNELNSPNKKMTPLDKVKKRNIKCDLEDINLEVIMKNINLILLGNSGVGKTNFMVRYSVNEFSQRFISTIGTNEDIKTIEIKDENNNRRNYKLKIFDTAGQERYRSIPRSYYKKADGILLFYDVNDIRTFEDVSIWITDIYQYCGEDDGKKKDKNENNIVIYLIGNKIDFLNNDEEEIGETTEEGENKPVTKKEKETLINNLKFPYYEISNKWNVNIEEVMARIILDCAKNVDSKKNDEKTKVIKSSKNNKKKKTTCCNN